MRNSGYTSNKSSKSLFPTCQLKVFKFYVSCLPPPPPPLRPPPPRPQPPALDGSVPCRTSTAGPQPRVPLGVPRRTSNASSCSTNVSHIWQVRLCAPALMFHNTNILRYKTRVYSTWSGPRQDTSISCLPATVRSMLPWL